jgi:soluble lytic murein transglycosylase-like protein
VPFEVVMALIENESDFNPALASDTDDHGLAQINRCNFDWLQEEMGHIDFYDPIQNVRASLRILGPLWAKYDPHKALMAYNQGEGGARGRWADGHVTSRYSRKVLTQAEAYRWEENTKQHMERKTQ